MSIDINAAKTRRVRRLSVDEDKENCNRAEAGKFNRLLKTAIVDDELSSSVKGVAQLTAKIVGQIDKENESSPWRGIAKKLANDPEAKIEETRDKLLKFRYGVQNVSQSDCGDKKKRKVLNPKFTKKMHVSFSDDTNFEERNPVKRIKKISKEKSTEKHSDIAKKMTSLESTTKTVAESTRIYELRSRNIIAHV